MVGISRMRVLEHRRRHRQDRWIFLITGNIELLVSPITSHLSRSPWSLNLNCN